MEEENKDFEIPTLKNSDQYFIQNNYQAMSLEQLVNNTQLPPDQILSYIDEYEAYLKEAGVNTSKRLVLSIGLNAEGSISYGIEWPDIQSIEELLPNAGKLFFLINSGKLKPSIVSFLAKYAEEKNAHGIVRRIMQDWSNYEKEVRESPLVSPSEVFKD